MPASGSEAPHIAVNDAAAAAAASLLVSLRKATRCARGQF
jgi:hypothetical protein